MKKTNIKQIVTISVVLGLMASAFAVEKGEQQANHIPQSFEQEDQENYDEMPMRKAPQNRQMTKNNWCKKNLPPCMPEEFMGREEHREPPKIDLMGTITAIDKNNKIITIKNADGKETKVHVNPYTKIGKPEMPGKHGQKPEKHSFDDMKIGDWIALNKFVTETIILEAAHILLN